MRRLLPFVVLAGLAACGDSPATQPSQPIVVRSEGQDKLHQLDYLNRAIALKRAIHAAGSDCRRVTQSGYVGEYENTSYWTATCEDGAQWTIAIGRDGIAQVMSTAELVAAAARQPRR